MKNKVTTFQETPNKYYMNVEVMTPSGVRRVSEAGSDGRFVWTLPVGTVGTVHEGEERENRLINFSIFPIFSWKSYFKQVKTVGLEDIDGALSSNSVDFVRIFMNARQHKDPEHIEHIKTAHARVRASDVKYEFCIEINKDTELEVVKNVYNSLAPCKNFVDQCNFDLDHPEGKKILNFVRDTKNTLLRAWN